MAEECRAALAVLATLPAAATTLVRIADRLTDTVRAGGVLYFCGNGGIAADARHVAAEFVGRFLQERAARCYRAHDEHVDSDGD